MMAHMNDINASKTRARLLKAAASLFAEKGFAATSVREICARAQVNQASINYHFGTKDKLIAEIIRLPMRQLDESIPSFSDPSLPLFDALRHMYMGLLASLRHGSLEAMAMRVMHRAMHDGPGVPHPDPDILQRHATALTCLLRRHLPTQINEKAIGVVQGALVGMGIHAITERFHEHPGPRMGGDGSDADVAALAERLACYAAAIVAAERQA